METRGTETIRHRARITPSRAGSSTTVAAPIQANQIQIPGTSITVTERQLLLGGAALALLVILLGATGGGRRQGLLISSA